MEERYTDVWKRGASFYLSDAQVEGRQRRQEVYQSLLRGKRNKSQPRRILVQGEVEVGCRVRWRSLGKTAWRETRRLLRVSS